MTVHKITTHNFDLDKNLTEIDSSSIDFPIRRNLLLQKQMIDVLIDYFSIDNIIVPDYLDVDLNSLLKLKFIGGIGLEGESINTFHLTSYNNPYQILLNHNAIIDCSELNKETAEIKFTVKVSIDKKIISKDYILTLNLIKARPNCTINFIAKEDLKYVHENACIGFFEIENLCPCRYAELGALNLVVKYPVQFSEKLVSFAMPNEIHEDNPYYEFSGLRERDESPISILKIIRKSGQEIELKRITTQNKISIPVYLDLDKLENPEDEVRYEKFIAIAKNVLNDIPHKPMECKIPIYRDFTKTRLCVYCNGKVVENNSKGTFGHYNWIERQTGKIERFSGQMQIAKIEIGNEATNKGISSDSAVILKNFKIYPIVNQSEIVCSEFNDCFNFTDIEDGVHILKNGVDSFLSYKCKMLHKKIIDMPLNTSNIVFNIEFDFYEDVNGIYPNEKIEWEHFRSEVLIEIEKDPGSEWLCVDYGTSATVAIFGDGTERNYQLLKLNERNKEIIDERENGRFRSPRFEEGEFFLSSNIMLQSNTPSIDSSSLINSLVYLSPSEPRFHAKEYRLPYMKALVGYKNIPNGQLYTNFKYKRHEADKDVITFGQAPFEVDTIFRATYRTLFRDYISKCIPQGKLVNKLVLTIPNTYTPHHIKYLRTIVQTEIESLRSDYIWFVSESDSIAYYYLKNWGSFNGIETRCFKNNTENVLVYDMGAGTLDITLLKIEHQEDGDKKVSMVSKMGLNKAGNYLDYVLAKALVDVYPDVFTKDILVHSDDDTMQNLLGKLKFFIKNKLKPNLFLVDKLVFSDWNGQTMMGVDFHDVEIDLKKIRTNSNVMSFVSECTDDLFERFIQTGNLSLEESPIDTLIMTGRSIQFGEIKKRLQNRINIWNDDNHCVSLEIKGEKLKTVVSQGALYYAALYGKRTSSVVLNNKNIYAKYGVLYVNRQNRWTYQPLIDPFTKSIGQSIGNAGQQNGMTIYVYDTDRYSADVYTEYINVDMRNSIEAYLVQCYSPNPADDYIDEETRNDYISVMAVFNPESVCQDTRNVHLRLQINENNEMIFTAGDLEFEASAPIKIDIETNNTFKHSMWPYA